jgi:D-glycero-D-manno-heptose 1,7-bisphosphate phosphatase
LHESSDSKLIILDRDGVINEDRDDYVKSADEWVPIPNSLEAIALLSQAGYILTIATNQSGIARGFYPLSELHAMHQKMIDLLKPLGGRIDGIFFCPHVDEDQCACRKPKPGLMHEIAKRYLKNRATQDLPLNNIPIVGDSLRDLVSRYCLRCITASGFNRQRIRNVNHADLPEGTQIHPDLMAFAKHIVSTVMIWLRSFLFFLSLILYHAALCCILLIKLSLYQRTSTLSAYSILG